MATVGFDGFKRTVYKQAGFKHSLPGVNDIFKTFETDLKLAVILTFEI